MPKEYYGILAGDEGWRFVPEEMALHRLKDNWSSRDFFSVVAFGNSVLIINLNHQRRHIEYIQSQMTLQKSFGEIPDEYFLFNPPVAGLNHGRLLIAEDLTIVRLLLNSFTPTAKNKPQDLKEYVSLRNKLADLLRMIQMAEITEINVMSEIISKNMNIPTDKVKLRDELELLEKTLTFKYTQRINTMLMILSGLSIIAALAGAYLTYLSLR